ncbi:F510_1955 family glycosylhydrolase [Streptomyces sp. NPDC004647]|uniref:F510_1955 family glycosylhydrolase n=1 Tax=Streptomyces sp. NPDC004647 TaxID=3154671 RepID=UPI0033BB4B08
MITSSALRSFLSWRRAAALLLTSCTLALAACSANSSDGTPSFSTSTSDPGTGHLHGLGVDPADGAVYAAGHLGVFRIDGGKAARIADRYQDTMGFTVTGPRTFLGSGHPDPSDPKATSPHLGLIRSTDAAKTWKSVSASGKADFHALQAAGDQLYGFDSQSGQLWASSNQGRTWQQRATEVMGDLAAHASQPERVWATTREGLKVSEDGGRTFTPVPGAPALAAIDRPSPDLLVALTADGRVVTSRDGTAWSERGRLPDGARPTVLAAPSPSRLLAADATDTIHESTDGGRSWNLLYRGADEAHSGHY